MNIGKTDNTDRFLLTQARLKKDWRILKTNKQRFIYQVNYADVAERREICNFAREQQGKDPIDFDKRAEEVKNTMNNTSKEEQLKQKFYDQYYKLDLKELEQKEDNARQKLVAEVNNPKYLKMLLAYEALVDCINVKKLEEIAS